MKHPLCLALVGPTASGKSAFAVEIAQAIDGEIISMDSTAIYKGFDIGSAKPSLEERSKVKHHLVDALLPNEPFSAHHYVELANSHINDIVSRNKIPILVGGTYFYLRALQNGMYRLPPIPADFMETLEQEFTVEDSLDTVRVHEELSDKDPETAKSIHVNDRYRLLRALAILRATGNKLSDVKNEPLEGGEERLWMKYALLLPREVVNQNIVARTERMIRQGLVEETKKLMEEFPIARALSTIGYNEAKLFLEKKLTEKQLRNEIIEKTRGLAKRQMTWLRSDPEIRFVDLRDLPRIKLEVENMKAVLA